MENFLQMFSENIFQHLQVIFRQLGTPFEEKANGNMSLSFSIF